MNRIETFKYQSGACGMIAIEDWANPQAFNFTFTEPVRTISPGRLDWDRRPHKNLKHFHNLANRQLLSRAQCRRGYRLGFALAFEFGGKSEGLHCHGMIECPDPEAIAELPDLFEFLWSKTFWGDHQKEIKPCDGQWPEYFLKLRTKPDYADCVPWDLWQAPLKLQHRA